MGKFIISEQEKNRILKMHQSTKMKPYLFEDDITTVTTTIKDLPEVTISAWLPPSSASEQAKQKGGKILMYFYNENCSYCEGVTQKLMNDNTFRKFIKDNNLTISKQKACGDYDGWGCTEDEKKEWENFDSKVKQETGHSILQQPDERLRGLPGLGLINSDFSKVYLMIHNTIREPEEIPYEKLLNNLNT